MCKMSLAGFCWVLLLGLLQASERAVQQQHLLELPACVAAVQGNI